MQRLNAERRNLIFYYLGSLKDEDHYNNYNRLNNIRLDNGENLINVLVSEHFIESKVLIAIKTLLYSGVPFRKDPDTGMNFIQMAINSGYSVNTICEMIHVASEFDFDFNDVDACKESIMHTAINNPMLEGSLEKLYDTLKCFGYCENAIKADPLMQAIGFAQKVSKYSLDHIERLERLKKYILEYETNKAIEENEQEKYRNQVMDDEDVILFESFGIFLTKQKYKTAPAIGREMELENIYLAFAQECSNPLLVGPSGSGKTALVEQLAYEIQKNNVPFYLKGRQIFEASTGDLVAGTRYRGDFEEKLKVLFDLCIKYNVILFIDEIHTIYGAGTSIENDNDFGDFLKIYIKRGLRVIGATTEVEYEKYFSKDALKRRFDKIEISVPSFQLIHNIVFKRLTDLANLYHINVDAIICDHPEIIDLLIESTDNKNVLYNDQMNNPDFVLTIINKSVACARRDESDKLTISHLIKAVSLTDRLYPKVREKLIKKIEIIGQTVVKDIKSTTYDISSRRGLYLKD